MEIVCAIVNGLVALAALAVLWRKVQSDPEVVRGMLKTTTDAFNAGLNCAVKETRSKIAMAEMELHSVFEVPVEPRADERVDGEVGLDDGDTEESP